MATAVHDKPQTANLREYVQSTGPLRVDRDKGIVYGVKVLGLESKNGRTYSAKAVNEARSLYEGAKVNIDHRVKGSDQRSYGERFGQLRNVVVDQAGLRADLHYNPKHSIAEQFAWDAENEPSNVGLSHDVEGRMAKRDGKDVVEAITKVNSVDLVADPATTRGLYESTHSTLENEAVDYKTLTLDALKAERPDLFKAFAESLSESEQAKAAAAELKAAKAKLDEYETRERVAVLEATIAKEIKDAKLAEHLVTDVFKASLREAKDATARKALIDDRAAIGKPPEAGGRVTSREQGADDSQHYTESYRPDAKRYAAYV